VIKILIDKKPISRYLKLNKRRYFFWLKLLISLN